MSENFLQTELQKVDPDRYLISLFTPKDRRESLWPLFLFNYEIAKTRFVVTETQLGHIRLQWWREEIAKLYMGNSAPDNPILQGLETALRYYGLPQALFENMLFAREFDLEGASPQGLEGLINYADLTTTPLNKLVLQIIGHDPSEETVQHISIRYCLVQILRHLNFYRENGVYLVSKEIENDVQEFLIKNNNIKTDILVLKAQNALSNIYLKQLKMVHFDANDPKLRKPPMFKELRVALSVSFQ